MEIAQQCCLFLVMIEIKDLRRLLALFIGGDLVELTLLSMDRGMWSRRQEWVIAYVKFQYEVRERIAEEHAEMYLNYMRVLEAESERQHLVNVSYGLRMLYGYD